MMICDASHRFRKDRLFTFLCTCTWTKYVSLKLWVKYINVQCFCVIRFASKSSLLCVIYNCSVVEAKQYRVEHHTFNHINGLLFTAYLLFTIWTCKIYLSFYFYDSPYIILNKRIFITSKTWNKVQVIN